MVHRFARAALGVSTGLLVGVPLGLALGVLAIQTVIPTSYWNERWLYPALIGAVALPFAGVGGWHGWAPDARTTRVVRGGSGFLLGFLLGAILALVLATVAIPVFGISQMEGGYAMGMVFVLMPLGGLVGGVVGAIRGVRRA